MIKRFSEWFKAWKLLEYPIFICQSYSSDLDKFISEDILSCYNPISIERDFLYLQHPDTLLTFGIYIGSKNYGSVVITGDQHTFVSLYARVSIKTMARIHNLTKEIKSNPLEERLIRHWKSRI